MQYTYLISGLEDLQFGQQPKMPYSELLELLEEQLTESDWHLAQLLNMRYDDPFVDDLLESADRQDILSDEDYRTQLLYQYGMQSDNAFVRSWFEFNLNLNNVLAVAICLKHGYDIRRAIVGDNDVAEMLRKGNLSKNTNLAVAVPELKEIVALAEISDLMERERAIDRLRWQWLEETTLFNYFELDNALAYMLQAGILDRWSRLNKERGEQVFNDIVADMKRDVKFNV